ncbi:oxygen-independent coproporphyrinogen-3 oxidase [Treponema bryantii]|uniref:Heme chaperone HemW n=1 Tax=Treponema bryantii TaxID=163 RepID=A0A1H9J0H3_9SPIR|nr:radical SAM family heme chaperone HemW [Treponema bryantii]SEQ80237.1 oxygen-independent coproporphyrinogen-3 oxidase [Treponema bryantii]
MMESSLYIHIPFCISKCAYCDFFSKPYEAVPDSYIDALCNEIDFRISEYNIKKLKTIYIGGGTPSLLTENQLKKIFSKIKSSVKLAFDVEITIEVNPDDVTETLLRALFDCGVTRISCGIQSMNDAVLKKACRRADVQTNKNAMEIISQKWKGEVSYDLISGLPGESEESLITGLKELCLYKPDHISLYSLTIEENTPFGKQFAAGNLDYDFDYADKLWLAGRDFLEAQGYKWYEVSNFCLPGKECRHNLVYWNHGNYIGCGSGACGTVYKPDGSGFRWTNNSDIDEYIKVQNGQPPQSSENIELETSQFEFFMMGLRKTIGISEKEYKEIFACDLPEKFLSLFNAWKEKGLCTLTQDGRYAMSREGMLFLNRFLEELF